MSRRRIAFPVALSLLLMPGPGVGALQPQPRPRQAVLCSTEGSDIPLQGNRGGRVVRPAVVAPMAAPPAVAPPAPPPPPPPPPAPQAERDESSSIVVSGSRIRNPVLNLPTPVIVIGGGASENRERYNGKEVAAVHAVAEAPVSTFSIDVDTGSYSNVRRMLNAGQMPPADAVRTEEMLNYFRYDYPLPRDRSRPFSVSTDVARTPWNAATRLIRVGIRGYDVAREQRPAANLVFLVDVSGSMQSPDKLPLVKAALMGLADRLNPRDRVAIVVYAGAAGLVLEPTHDKEAVKAALDCLEAGGSTAGGQGLKLAYATARKAFIRGGINRVILCTDGDFNVGTTSDSGLKQLVKAERDSGITLTALGFGEGNLNDAMMEAVADVGNGNYGYVDSAMEARKLLDDELSSTLFTIASDVKIQVEFNPSAISEYRLIGYENRALREEDFDNDAVDAGDIGAGHQVTALYEVVLAGSAGWLPERRYASGRAAPAGGPQGEAAWLKLRYKLPGEQQSRLIEQPIPAAQLRDAAPVSGDLAFTAAVAAFGQKLRGDTHLGRFGYREIEELAGSGGDYWRQEFGKLVSLAASARSQAGGQ